MTEPKSAVVVTVRQALIDWLRANGVRRPYFPEEDCVWVIPSTSSLSSRPDGISGYIEKLKPDILSAEFECFGPDLSAKVLSGHAFDEFIDLQIRDDVVFAPLAPETPHVTFEPESE